MAREKLCGAILAAGHGSITTGKSKLLEKINDRCTIIEMVVDLLDQQLDINQLTVIVNTVYGDDLLAKIHANCRDIVCTHQNERRGTAHAVKLCIDAQFQALIAQAKKAGTIDFDPAQKLQDILIIYGDMPLWTGRSLATLIDAHRQEHATLSMFSINVACLTDEPVSLFGRILRGQNGNIIGVKEPWQMTIVDVEQWSSCQTVNPSAWVFNIEWLMRNIPLLRPHNKEDGYPDEYWLPDLVPLAVQQKRKIVELPLSDYHEALGVNTAEDLKMVREIFQQRYSCV